MDILISLIASLFMSTHDIYPVVLIPQSIQQATSEIPLAQVLGKDMETSFQEMADLPVSKRWTRDEAVAMETAAVRDHYRKSA